MLGLPSSALICFSLATVLTACGASNIRPWTVPFPEARVDTVDVEAASLIERLNSHVTNTGLEVARISPEEGFLETRWFDLATRRSRKSGGDPERVVRMRFWADPVMAGRSVLISEVVYLQSLDPSLLPRDAETLAPPDHAGHILMTDILEAVLENSGG